MSIVLGSLLVLLENPQVGDGCPCQKEKLSNRNGCQFSPPTSTANSAASGEISVACLPRAGHIPDLSTLYGTVCPIFPFC